MRRRCSAPDQAPINFQERPTLLREALVLPDGVLESIEAQVVGVAAHRERLLASRQHPKRGLLLHADLLEPALAARPGRVDQAVKFALPDANARRQLLAVYRGALLLDLSDGDAVVSRTSGVTASFL